MFSNKKSQADLNWQKRQLYLPKLKAFYIKGQYQESEKATRVVGQNICKLLSEKALISRLYKQTSKTQLKKLSKGLKKDISPKKFIQMTNKHMKNHSASL